MLGSNQDKSKLRIQKLMTERDRNLPKRFGTSLFFIIHVRTKVKERNKKFEQGTVSKVTDTECAVRMLVCRDNLYFFLFYYFSLAAA